WWKFRPQRCSADLCCTTWSVTSTLFSSSTEKFGINSNFHRLRYPGSGDSSIRNTSGQCQSGKTVPEDNTDLPTGKLASMGFHRSAFEGQSARLQSSSSDGIPS